MVISKRRRIILESKAAGNPEYGSNNPTVIFEYISHPNLPAVLVFQARVLADGGGINLMFESIITGKLSDEIPFFFIVFEMTNQ